MYRYKYIYLDDKMYQIISLMLLKEIILFPLYLQANYYVGNIIF